MTNHAPLLATDRQILRELAARVADIAALPVQQETIGLWKALNALRPRRPMVMIGQVPWNEMNVNDELTLRCQGDFACQMETRLRRTLYAWDHMRADMVVEPFIEIRKARDDDDFGIPVDKRVAVTDPQSQVQGHYFLDHLQTDEDIARIHQSRIELDRQAIAELEEQAHDIFDGLLSVRMQGFEPWFHPWDWIVFRHGVEATLCDLAMRKDFSHRLIARLTEAYFARLDAMEAQGLLRQPQSLIHCTGAWSDELPAPGYDPGRPRAKDLWTAGMAQIFSAVSPAMHKEYEIDYAIRWYARFGLGYYGCCEPLDDRIDVVRLLPNVRKISMSAWVDVERGARSIGPDYVFSRKPSPALLAAETFSPAAVEADLTKTLDACARHGCPVELILKDISTVRYQPQRLWEWSSLAMRLVRAGQ